MENAPKALIMAATMIIAVMMFAVLVYVFRAGASLDATYDLEQTKDSLNLYNAKFELYNRDDVPVSDIISVSNLAYNINYDNNFDVAAAVEIVVNAGGQYFVIPRTEPPVIGGERFNRNKIFSVKNYTGDVSTGEMISVYDLVDKKMSDLGISVTGMDPDDKLSTSKLGSSTTQNAYGVDVERHNATVYKYLFKCNGAEYNQTLGKVIKLEFELTGINSNW